MHSECNHTVHHITPDGRPLGSWHTDPAGLRIECSVCGRFYGYLPHAMDHHSGLPERVPRSSEQAEQQPAPRAETFEAPQATRHAAQISAVASTTEARLPRLPLDYKRLRELVTMDQVLDLVSFEPTSRTGDQLRGPCPVHQRDGSRPRRPRIFSVDVRGGRFQCFDSACAAKGNQLDLWAAVTELPLYEAALLLCEKTGIDPPQLDAA